MMTLEQCTYHANGHKLVFGIFALKQFNLATQTYPTIFSVVAYFNGHTQLNGLIEMVRAGYEQGNRKVITPYEAADIVQTFTAEQQDEMSMLFYSSIVGEDFITWAERQKQALEQAEADAVGPQPETTDSIPKS
ncbi:hypothetical protein FAES_3976 [Fibrella aestuarina BUZ 2]|uniref:Uncharacterized protein n=1 Tax=Fibrella aestuarina BUZ 2 TaxID=1166018 RepID=I0KCX4_9BACT|nr:hypothetical protein [Fibrella aestuarina]CCH01977.1 hypothetical protein FAES_3976 [Fibrella aestuarina BUZ 2]